MVLGETLKSPLDCKENKLIHFEGINPECSLEGHILKLRLQDFGHLMRRLPGEDPDVGKRGRQRTGWMDSVIKATNMNLTQLRQAVEDRRAWHTLVHGGHKESDTT